MYLLVSVSSPADASAALAGGADVIDTKDPGAGALGPVQMDVFSAVVTAVSGVRTVTAAIGDGRDETGVERAALRYAAAGAALVKLGFAGITDRFALERLAAAAVRGADAASPGRSGVVAVAYADAAPPAGPDRNVTVEVAARVGARGVLLDTTNKRGPGLRGLVTARELAGWVARAHGAGLFVALAGRLRPEDVPFVRDAGADVAGVRGAACEGGRRGRVSAERVRRLSLLCGGSSSGLPASLLAIAPP